MKNILFASILSLASFAPTDLASAAQVDAVRVPSAAMKREIPAMVVLPDAAASQPTRRFPVLYLLHGAGDNERGWLDRTPVREMADRHGVIIITPAVGNSWYFDSPEAPDWRFETFVASELVAFTDARYRTIAKREARALAGNSMGGHGAMFLAVRHQDTFCATAPMSGGMDIRASDPQVGAFPENWELKQRLGSIQTNPNRWNELTVINQVDRLNDGDLAISLDCGTEDFFLNVNRQLHAKLTARGILHNYAEHPGTHNWDYWKLALPRQMAFLSRHLEGASNGHPEPGDADFPQPSPSARHAEKVAAVRSGDYDLVLIGDSITHTLQNFGGKYDALNAVWNKHYAPRHAINLGHNGYRTEQILWNLQNGELDFKKSPKVFVILLGTNNSDRRNFPRAHTAWEILNGIRAIVELIRERHPSSKILVLRPFPKGLDAQRGEATSPPVFSFSQSEVDALHEAGALMARLADGKNIFWLDVNHIFLRPDGRINTDLMWDLLHPNAAGAEAWAQAIEPTLAELMGDKPIVPRGTFHVFLLMGQSNMAGHAPLEDGDEKPVSRVVEIPTMSRSDFAWQPAAHPLHNRLPATDRFGLGLPFAIQYVQSRPNVTVGLIPVAWGGEQIDHLNKNSPTYRDAITKARWAAKQGFLKGVLWHQGESDTVTRELAGSYATKLDQLVADLRSDLGEPSLPFIAGNLAEFYGTGPDHNAPARVTQINQVRQALRELPRRVPQTAFVETTGLNSEDSHMVHFNRASYIELGKRYAQAIEPLLAKAAGNPPAADPPPTSAIPVPRSDGSYDWQARHEAALNAKAGNPQIVFIGDSITHHLGGVPAPTGPFVSHRGDAFWAAVTKDRPGLNLGFGADWTQHVLWRIDHGELDGLSPRHVVLMIGTNNVLHGDGNPADIVAGVRACLLRIRAKTPCAQVVLMGVLPCRNPATHPNRLLAARVNEGLKKLAEEAKSPFLDLTPKFLDASGNIPPALMDDAIHPTPAGYKIWAEAVVPKIKELLNVDPAMGNPANEIKAGDSKAVTASPDGNTR